MNFDELYEQRVQALAPPEDKPASTPGELYTKYIGGPASDLLDISLQKALPGLPPTLRQMVVGTVAPETLTQAGMTVGGMLAPGLPAAKAAGTAAREIPYFSGLLRRVLGPVAGGAFGGLLEKGDPADMAIGAVGGLGAGVVGEAVSMPTKFMAKSRLARQFAKEDPERIGRVMNQMVKEFPNLSTPEQFGSVFWGKVGQDKLSEMYGSEIDKLAAAVAKSAPVGSPRPASQVLASQLALITPSGELRSPEINQLLQQKVISGPTTFEVLAKEVRNLRLKGKTASGDPAATPTQADARMQAEQLSGAIESALATIHGGLAGRYKNMDYRYARGAEMMDLATHPGIIDENNRLNVRLLQDKFVEDNRAGLYRKFSPLEVRQLRDALFRGADTTARDIMKKSVRPEAHLYASGEGKPRLSTRIFDLFKTNEYAGQYSLPRPYINPKAAQLGAQRIGSGIKYALDRPIMLKAEDTPEEVELPED